MIAALFVMAMLMGCADSGRSAAETGLDDSDARLDAVEKGDGPLAPGEEMTSSVPGKADSLVMVARGELKGGERFRVLLQPYGYGPSSGPELLFVVRAADPLNSSDAEFDYLGEKVLARVTDDSIQAIDSGGAFSAVLTVRERADLLAFEISELERMPVDWQP